MLKVKTSYVYLFFLLGIVIQFSCLKPATSTAGKMDDKLSVSNMVEFIDGKYIDKTMISLRGWYQYAIWLSCFEETYEEDWQTKVDSTIWGQHVYKDEFLKDIYFQTGRFREYPIVGITKEQAVSYTKWREEAILYYTLLSNYPPYRSKLKENPCLRPFNYLKLITPTDLRNAGITKLPVLSLPTSEDFEILLKKKIAYCTKRPSFMVGDLSIYSIKNSCTGKVLDLTLNVNEYLLNHDLIVQKTEVKTNFVGFRNTAKFISVEEYFKKVK